MIKKSYIAIFLIFLFIALIIASIEESINTFFSWFFIGLWSLFTLKFFEKWRQSREFSSPHNTPFYTLGPLFIGILFNFWGYYTTILNQNLLEGSNLYISYWVILFALPYLIYAYKIIYNCFKKFDIAYIYKAKSVQARSYGFFCTVLLISLGFSTLLIVYSYWQYLPVSLIHHDLDLMLLISIIIATYLLIVPGFLSMGRTTPELTPEYIERRRRAIERVATTPARSPPQVTSTRIVSGSTTRSPPQKQTKSTSTRRTPSNQTHKKKNVSPISSKSKTKTTTVKKALKRKPQRKIDFSKYRPKAGTLSEDDFKCIFCFQLPKLPEDEKRGIILCPSCNYPAHADEFKDWMKSSSLCSRCDSPIPVSFRRSPRVINVKNYLLVIKHFSKRN